MRSCSFEFPESEHVTEISINRLLIELSIYRFCYFHNTDQTLMGFNIFEVAELKFSIKISINRFQTQLSIYQFCTIPS